jgi:hypothetical protein
MRRRIEANSPAPLVLSHYDAANTDVVVMDQPNLFFCRRDRGGAGVDEAIFLATAPSRRAPIVPQRFWGTTPGSQSVKSLIVRD